MNFMSTMDVDFADTINKHHLNSLRGSLLSISLSQLDIVDENGCLSCSSTSASGTYQNGSEIGSDSQETFPWTLHSTTGGISGSITSDSSTISKPILKKNKSNTSNYNPFSLYPQRTKTTQTSQITTQRKENEKEKEKENKMVQQRKEKPSQIEKTRIKRLGLPMYSNSNSSSNSSSNSNTDAPMAAPMVCEDKVDCSLVLKTLPKILDKFDVLFPFYRLSDKDCKHLSYIIYDELNMIEKVFCDSVARLLVVKIYYYGSEMARKFYFYNKQDSDKQVAEWKDINMTEEYCLQQLGYHQDATVNDSNESHRRSFSQNLNGKMKMQMKSKAVTMGMPNINRLNSQHNKTLSCQI